MKRFLWSAAVGVFAGAAAADDAVNLGRFQPAANGAGVAAATPTAPADTERVFHKRAWPVVAYTPYYYYPAWGYGYVGGWYGGYSSFYSPGFAVSYYSAPVYTGWGYPGWWGGGFVNYGFGGFYPIADRGTETPTVRLVGTRAPAQTPSVAVPEPQPAFRLESAPTIPGTVTVSGKFRYDGGPASPVPMPSGTSAGAEYRFVGYGDKR